MAPFFSHLLVCGDITGTHEDPSETTDLADFRKALRDAGFDNRKKATVIPGNHDYLHTGVFHRKVSKETYGRKMQRLLSGRRSGRRYPTYQLLNGIAIVGIDTIAETVLPKAHLGGLAKDELDDLSRILALPSVSSRRVVLAMHHGPYGALDHHIYNHDLLWEHIDKKLVDLIVFGHDHSSYEEKFNGIPALCVGGFMHDDGYALQVRTTAAGSLRWSWWKPKHW